MNKIALVARHEYWFNLRRPAFLFAVFGVPLFTFIVWFVVFAVTASNEENLSQVGQVGYVDQAGILSNPVASKDSPIVFTPYADLTTAREALDNKAIGYYFVLPNDYMKTGSVEIYGYSSVPSALKDELNNFLLANLNRGLESTIPLERIQNPVEMTIHTNDSGRNLTEANIPALFFIPMIFSMLFLMSSGVTSGFLMNGVVEEKTNRIIEILITSITPMQMLMGKIIGLGALGLTQMVVWLGAGGLLIRYGQAAPVLNGISFPLDLMLVFVVYFVLSYFLLASLMAGIGAVVGSEQESRQASTVISLIFVIPFFFIVNMITDPNGAVPIILSLFPFTSPLAMLLRLGFGSVPMWQLVASLLILLITTLFIVWASARVFRWALLLYGKRATPREIWRVIRSSPQENLL